MDVHFKSFYVSFHGRLYALLMGVLHLRSTTCRQYTEDRYRETKMLNELILTTTICLAIVAAMGLFYGEIELLQGNH